MGGRLSTSRPLPLATGPTRSAATLAMSGLSAVPGEQPLKVEGASKRNKVAQCGKEYCCTPSLKCGLVWLCCTPLVVLLLLVIIAFSYLDVQAKNPPPLVDAPKAESSTQMEAEFEFGDDGAANAFSTAMADSSSSIYNAMEDAWNSVLEPGRVEEDEGLEVEDARRRGLLESEGRRELTHGSYRKIRAKFRRCRDTCSDESRSKRRSCRSTCRRKLARLMAKLAGDSRDNGAEETLSEAVRIALEEAGHNTTVSVESLSARSSGVYFVCEVDEPFGDAAACGGAVNTVLRNSAEVRDAIASVRGASRRVRVRGRPRTPPG